MNDGSHTSHDRRSCDEWDAMTRHQQPSENIAEKESNMTLPISTQITNLKARAIKLGVHPDAVADVEASNDAPKAIIFGLRTLIADAQVAGVKASTQDAEVDPVDEAPEAPVTKKSSKKGARSDAPTKKDKAVKAPPANRKMKDDGNGEFVVKGRGQRANKMDVKNTTLNAIRFADAQNKGKGASLDDIAAALTMHGVKVAPEKVRMSIANLSRDERVKSVARGVYKAV